MCSRSDERAATLEQQVLMPLQNPVEMGNSLPQLVEKIQARSFYKPLFVNAFGSEAVTTWIKDRKIMVYKGDKKHLPDTGGIALQVHGGGDWTKHFVRYRNIRVKELKK